MSKQKLSYHELSENIFEFIDSSIAARKELNSACASHIQNFIDEMFIVREKLNDTDFYIGVIGEFSCGKTTFINAFIEQRYLVEDTLSGTTCAPTIIRYSDKENVIVNYDNGKTQKMVTEISKIKKNFQSFFSKTKSFLGMEKGSDDSSPKEMSVQDFLKKVTATEEEAKYISEVSWIAPLEALKDGLILVDTPGISSDNPRHTKVAKDAAKKCDGLLILSPLSKPLSDDLIKTVEEISERKAENCIFVGTQLDRLPQKEHSRMKTFFDKKLKDTFAKDSHIFFVSAYKALEDMEDVENRENQNNLEEFRSFRLELHNLLLAKRQYMQSVKISKLVTELTNDIRVDLQEEQEKMREQQEKFNNAVIPDDSEKWNYWQQRMESQFNYASSDILADAKEEMNNVLDLLHAKIKLEINVCETKDELKRYLNDGINSSMEENNAVFEAFMGEYIESPLVKKANFGINEFKEEFEKEYQALADIFSDSPHLSYNRSEFTNNSILLDDKSREFKKLADDFDSEENKKIGGGLATGIAVSFMIPGVGWIAGAGLTLLSGILGAGFLSSLEDNKKDAEEKVSDFFTPLYYEMRYKIEDVHTEINSNIQNLFMETLEETKDEYAHIVEEYNKNTTQKANELKALSLEIDSYVATLSNLENNIIKIKDQLSQNL